MATTQSHVPWHLWVIGVVALLWNGMGAMDYVMTQTRNAAYMSGFTPKQLTFFYALPTWVVAAWAIGDTFSLGFTAVIFLVALGLYFYARAMDRRGVLA